MKRTILALSRNRAAAFVVAAALTLLSAASRLPLGGAAAAQETAAKSDAVTIIADLDEIERMRVLNPLKLNADQMDKLIAALTAAKADYDKSVNTIGASVFGASSTEVRDVKKRVIAGEPIPKEFDDKMKKLQADFLKQRDDLNTANIKRVAAESKAILTEKQVAAATKMERDQWEKDHTDSKSVTDAQLYNLYCVDVFISAPSAIPVLKEMRAVTK